jgi:hypothetical protein
VRNNLLTIIESPYAGDRARNHIYLQRAIRDSVARNELPFASHGFFTFVYDDLDPQQRRLGISLGYGFWRFAERVVFYIDYGMSNGMQAAERRLKDSFPNMKTAVRRIGKNDD